ncbi:HAMP domain-containing histidine kinase [Pseudooceanicola sp. CBS1P-1]|uniref:histidine kinase n=1 Tax=Pseudooceanicola albus TaxID=2692189 RepID=A0A6L7G4S2_9RHOB|nr:MULTISPECIES: HAMP domain-containing sensor histidine kinase [Pseudooceanicola]MBT9384715.1 HAMP domain-containing histidine kinase [Pseudooceanicola endophyticus]MXN18416.1 histidine kinase [Pseudooceanicola albus]
MMRADRSTPQEGGASAPQGIARPGLRSRAGLSALLRSPMTRKIFLFNFLALLLVTLLLMLTGPHRSALAWQRAEVLSGETAVLARLVEGRLESGVPEAVLRDLPLAQGRAALFFGADGQLLASTMGRLPASGAAPGPTPLADLLIGGWRLVTGCDRPRDRLPPLDAARQMLAEAPAAPVALRLARDAGTRYAIAAAPVAGPAGGLAGTLALTAPLDAAEALLFTGTEHLLRGFLVALLAMAGLSLLLAAALVDPLDRLVLAAEAGERPAPGREGARVRLPDLTARGDEVGRLSGALRRLLSALYDRIETNEQFAADVAHEIKNPLASLRSAVSTLRRVEHPDQRARLLEVIEHDVRRLDRLVSDISTASRLDAELVREDQAEFDLLAMLSRLAEYSRDQASASQVSFVTDLPPEQIRITGMEARLAQVFVNLIANAISFSEPGDAIRLWVRRRENRVLVVVEDTGPGIPESALGKIFDRFYSDRPGDAFGEHSGLGLAISKQIVEAHGGVIWAENIRPTEADPLSDPLGARFVVGLPI